MSLFFGGWVIGVKFKPEELMLAYNHMHKTLVLIQMTATKLFVSTATLQLQTPGFVTDMLLNADDPMIASGSEHSSAHHLSLLFDQVSR